MVEESAKEEWVRMLTERPPDRDEDESRYVQAVGESGFMLLELVATEDADLMPGDRLAVEGEAFGGVTRRLTHHTLTQDAQNRLKETIAAIIADNEQSTPHKPNARQAKTGRTQPRLNAPTPSRRSPSARSVTVVSHMITSTARPPASSVRNSIEISWPASALNTHSDLKR